MGKKHLIVFEPQLLVIYDDGETTQVSGQNKLFNEFVANGGFVGDFSGKGSSVSKLHDMDYHVAKMKVLRYDQTFKICGGDARKGIVMCNKCKTKHVNI